MADGYSVKVYRPDGVVVEVTGDDKDWVSATLQELEPVWSQPAGASARAAAPRTGRPQTPRAANQAPTEGDGAQQTGRRRRRGSGGSGRASRNEELVAQLTPEVRKALEKHVKDRQTAFDKTQPQAAAITATFLTDNLNRSTINASDLYTVYVSMGWRVPSMPKDALHNAQWRNKFFDSSAGAYTLTHKGENFGRTDSLNSAQ